MAVSARFVADFSSFNQAVDKAVQKLGLFEKSTEGVEKSLNRMVDSFSGQKIVREATIAAEAVEAIGGKSKLTQDELQRVGTLAQQAAEKLRLMGQDVPPKMQELANAVAKPNTAMTLWNSTILKVGASLAATFSVGAIIAAIKNTGQWAGEIDDLSKKLGISTEAVQRLDFAARQSGSSMDQVATAITLLSKNLVEGDGAAVPALERLGLSFETLKALSPEEAFKRVGVALSDLPSDVERLATAQQLLGRSGADLIPMFQDLEKDMGRAVVASDEMIKAGDRLGDSWDALVASGKVLLVNILGPMAPAISSIATVVGEAVTLFLKLQAAQEKVGGNLTTMAFGSKGVGKIGDEIARADVESQAAAARSRLGGGGAGAAFMMPGIERFEKEVARMETSVKKTTGATIHAKTAQDDWNESILKANEGMTFMVGRFGRDFPAAIEATAVSIEGRLVPALQHSEAVLAKMMVAMPAAIGSQGASQGVGAKSGFLGSMLQNLTGGGGISGILGKVGTGIFEGFGNMLSGGLSSLINSGIGLIGKGIGKLFGGLFGGEGKKVNDMRDQFIAAAGGIDVLAAKAMAAGTSVDKLLSAKKVKDFEAAVESLQSKLGNFADEQAADAARLETAIQKYGFAFEEAGAAFQKLKLDEQAKELIEDWRVLVGSGINLELVNERMAEAINEYLQIALRVGSEVPNALRPILQKMIEQGLLTDEAGNAISDLEATGIHFAETMTEGFDRVVGKLDELIQKLLAAGTAIENLPSVPTIGSAPVEVPFLPPVPAEGYAGGTGGRYLDFGAGRRVTLHGRERVMTEAEGRAEGGQDAIVDEVAGLRYEMRRLVLMLPSQISAAVATVR